MSSTPGVNEDFDFKDIFPTCLKSFNMHSSEAINDDYILKNTCTMIIMYLERRQGISESFIAKCKELVLYLDYIENNLPLNNIKPCCNYFNFKLKYLLNHYYCPDKSTQNAYNIIINQKVQKNFRSVPKVCQQYIDELTVDNFENFNDLNKLYNSLKILGSDTYICPYNNEYFNKYTNLLNKWQDVKQASFCTVLDLFKLEYIKENEADPQNKDVSEHTHSQIDVSGPIYSSMLTHTRETFLTITIITFAISTIIFILYKMKNMLHYSIHSIVHTKTLLTRIIEYSSLDYT
ncbi:variable surface protein [Plasmodium gonderi]|uniref:Variable surface protein n=1 Tax=Plasmodium gonderi TaxID=77519 RepID=A0A1Y1JXU5_PLAGO|nr:variable surface protein [Plasmodium gonderi]GAW84604.1 variable surface protein [Plasmodium gonderi]